MVGRHCEREWLCVDGKWVKTDATRLSEKEIENVDVAPYLFEQTCESGSQAATALNNALRNATKLEEDAASTEQSLGERCSGG